MNEYRQQHIERKNRVISCYTEALGFLRKNGYETESSNVEAQLKNVKEDGFVISVIGEYSSGKSTFLNALMGESLLPSFSRETTATLNNLRHIEKSKNGCEGMVVYNDGSTKDIAKVNKQVIADYVSTGSKKEDVASKISHFDLFIDNKFLQDNVTLVDTPGLNGLLKGHKDITQRQIERSNASIFLFHADQAGSKTDFEALAMLRRRVKSIFLVLNQIDLISASKTETVEDVVNNLRQKFRSFYGDESDKIDIIPISAREALVARSNEKLDFRGRTDFTPEEKAELEKMSNIEELEDKLWHYLTAGEKGRQMLLSPINQLVSQLSDVMDSLDNALNVLNGNFDAEKYNHDCNEINSIISEMEAKKEKAVRHMKSEVKDAQDSLIEAIEAEVVQFKNRYLIQIENLTDLDDIDPERIQNKIEQQFSLIVSMAMRTYVQNIERIMFECNADMTSDISDMLQSGIKISGLSELRLTSFDSGIDKFQHDIELYENEINELEEKLINAEDNSREARRLKRERDSIERKKEAAEESKRWYRDNANQMIPSVRTRHEEYVDKEKRGGILGAIGNVLVGEKYVTRTRTITDSSEREEYIRTTNDTLSRYDDEIDAYKTELVKYDGVDPEKYEIIQERIAKKLDEKRKEMDRVQKEYAEKIRKKYAQALRVHKESVGDYLMSACSKIQDEVESSMRRMRDTQVNAMATLVTSDIISKIKQKRTELEQLQKLAMAAESERKSQIEITQQRMESLRKIMINAMEIQEELENITDVVID